jgi:DNA-directed RNA polymerase I, II, and III subunit RPABC2
MSDDEQDSKVDEDEEDVEEEEDEEEEDEEEIVEDVDIEPELNSQLEENSAQSEYLGDYYNQFDDNKEYIKTYHPEELHLSFEEIYNLSLVTRNAKGYIIDDNHKTFPVLSKYEKAKIIGIRVNQLNYGAIPFVTVQNLNLDKVLIVEEELRQKKLPFIIKRPIPNGKFEYWNIKDLELI